jgi:hypothetical protein
MCSGTGIISTALSSLLHVSPRCDGADRPAPAAQNLGVGLLVTALTHLHVRNRARRFDWIRFYNFFPMALPFFQLFEREGLHHQSQRARTHNFRFSLEARCVESPLGGDCCSKLKAPQARPSVRLCVGLTILNSHQKKKSVGGKKCAILAAHPRALEPGRRQHIWRGGSLAPGYSWQ